MEPINESIPFLCARIKELREKCGYTMDQMAQKIATNGIAPNKSSLSRVETGKTSRKMLEETAIKYCHACGMTDVQIRQFLRGEKIAVPDTSALLKNTHLIEMLNREYDKVIIPKTVLDELDNIKNNNGYKYSKGLSRKAWEVIRGISYGKRTLQIDYDGDPDEDNNDCKIIYIAKKSSEQYHSDVDIVTQDTDYSAYLKGNQHVKALYLREFIATRQKIVNMPLLLKIDDFYSDSYEGLTVPDRDEINAYLPDGNTLLISCVRNTHKPLEQRKEKIKWLIENGAEIDKCDCGRQYLPAISHAIQKNQYEIFELLLDECGADPNKGSRNPYGSGKVRQKNEGNMPLMIAAWHGREKFVKKLCDDQRTSLNQQDENGFTALIKACANGYVKCRDILIGAGADTKIIDLDGHDYEYHYNKSLDDGPLATRFSRNKKKTGRGKFGK